MFDEAGITNLVRPDGTVVMADVARDISPARFLNGFVDAHNPIGRSVLLDDATARLLAGVGLTTVSDELTAIAWRVADRLEAGA